jgi:putative salt-induced outer membrane protein YdiY
MGEVKIDRSAVAAISSDLPLTVTLASGNKLVGTVQSAEKNAVITAEGGRTVSVPYSEVQAMRTAAVQAAWDREQLRLTNPPLLDFWVANVSLSLATASGNAKTTTFGTGASAERVTGSDKITLAYSQMYSRQSTTAPFGATANRISGAAGYDHNITPKLFGFLTNSYDFDEFLDLDLRSVLGGGLGYHIYKSTRSYWDAGLGVVWNHEKFGTGVSRNSGEMLLNEDSSHQLNSILSVFQKLSIYPNVTDTGVFRMNFDGGANFKLTRTLNWNVALSDRYLSNPIAGKKHNDVLLTTGIGITFSRR